LGLNIGEELARHDFELIEEGDHFNEYECVECGRTYKHYIGTEDKEHLFSNCSQGDNNQKGEKIE